VNSVKSKNNLIIIILIVVIVGAGAFFAGMKYQESKSIGQRQLTFGQGSGRIGNGQGGFNRGMRPVAGEIISSDANSLTVKMQDGSTRIVILSEKTEINKAEKTSKENLKTGQQVAVFGTENSDGSVTAQNIQLNPQFRQMIDRPTPQLTK